MGARKDLASGERKATQAEKALLQGPCNGHVALAEYVESQEDVVQVHPFRNIGIGRAAPSRYRPEVCQAASSASQPAIAQACKNKNTCILMDDLLFHSFRAWTCPCTAFIIPFHFTYVCAPAVLRCFRQASLAQE
eukprot:1156090-Pelagomonas_calceolata.AAC.2